ncbi:MAG: phosphate transporter substrate-binding protein [Burkholderia sp.]|jgi:ABC-type phosphate/phosphonate transport system substrate-binding protein|nr:phosphate transporter substrate-binding protein [Burkholderia sp.]
MRRWKIGLPMYRDCAPADHRLLVSRIVDGLHAAGWTEPVDLVDEPGDLPAFWCSPDLLLGQACGYPLMTSLAGRVRLLGTPSYDFPGCADARYCSFVMVARDASVQALTDLRGKRAVFNQRHSQSGMNALRHVIAPLARRGRFFSSVVASGSHRASLHMVAHGQADVAAIDCITHGYLALHAPHVLDGLRILCRTAATTGLPLITSREVDDATSTLLRQVLRDVCTPDTIDTPASRLRLAGFAATQLADYDSILASRRLAQDCFYPELA